MNSSEDTRVIWTESNSMQPEPVAFRSVYYPARASRFMVTQEYAMKYYGIFSVFVMAGVMLKVNARQEIFWFAIIGELAAILLGNFFANADMNRRMAEILFVNDTVSLVSIDEALQQKPGSSFPLRFANPTRTEHVITLHYEDRIVLLKRDDWGDHLEEIWKRLTGQF